MNTQLSIITVNLNNKEGLQQTISSVINQNFSNYEFIIIDGGSLDGSANVIKQYADKINYYVSEQDTGIYNAMNKGVRIAQGDYLYFLNSGDTFFSKQTLSKIFNKQRFEKLVIGNTASFDKKNKLSVFKHDKIVLDWFTNFNVNHQAVFFHRSVFADVGIYDETYKICADHKLIFETLMQGNFKYDYVDIPVCIYDTAGLSARTELEALRIAEKNNILSSYFSDDHWKYLREVHALRSAFNNMRNSKIVKASLYVSGKLKKIKTFLGV